MLGADEECSCGRCERTFMSLIYITTATTSSVWSMPSQQSPVGPLLYSRAAPRQDSPLLSRGVCSPGEQSQEREPACLYLGRMGSRCCDTTATLFLLFFSSSWAICLSVCLSSCTVCNCECFSWVSQMYLRVEEKVRRGEGRTRESKQSMDGCVVR